MRGQAKDLSDCNTCFIYDEGERESGLEANLRLNSLMFAYVRVIGEKMFEGAAPRHQLSFDNPPRPADTRAMIELEQACQRILAVLAPLPPEPIPLDAAVGRVAAEPILSPIDLPPFDNSAMDGYAVNAADLRSARAEAPVKLELLGQVAAGQAFAGKVRPGTCVRLLTGSAMPPGADAVVMQEDVRLGATDPPQVLFGEAVKPWENTRLRGEDVKRGAELLAAGDRLTAMRVGLLAAVGLKALKVARQPRIGLLATGNELVEPGQSLPAGKIYESNRAALAALLTAAGALPRAYPVVPDTLAATTAMLEQALAECDGLVTTGGVSVGELDFVKNAFEQIGGEIQFWRVAMKPGKPFVFGRWRQRLLFGLPGNPVSAVVAFLLLVRPALLRWQGATRVDLPAHSGHLAESLVNRGDRRHFMRVTVDPSGNVRSAGLQASHSLGSLAAANGLVDVPPRTTWPAGTVIRVMRLDF